MSLTGLSPLESLKLTTICEIPGKGTLIFVPHYQGLRLILASAPQEVAAHTALEAISSVLPKSDKEQRTKYPSFRAGTNVRDGRIQKCQNTPSIPRSWPDRILNKTKVPAMTIYTNQSLQGLQVSPLTKSSFHFKLCNLRALKQKSKLKSQIGGTL